MDREQYVHKRKKKYMAQVLEAFEERIEPHLPAEAAGDVQDFKGMVRRRMNALAVDAADVMALDNGQINQAGQDIRDRLHPTGRPR